MQKHLHRDIYLLPHLPLKYHVNKLLVKMYFTHNPQYKNLKYLLILVYIFLGWIEAFPTTKETVETVTKILLQDIIPRLGLLQSIQLDIVQPSFLRIHNRSPQV